jgi:hypothetical protein
MTMDNGATWTAITVTAGWTLVSIPTQTLTNPTVGFQIVTNGDAIAVDFVQNENGVFATSPIVTTTVSVTRALDVVSMLTSAISYSQSVGTLFSQFNATIPLTTNGASNRPTITLSDNAANTDNWQAFVTSGGTVIAYRLTQGGAGTVSANGSGTLISGRNKNVRAATTNDFAAYLNGVQDLTDATVAMPTVIDRFYFGETTTGTGSLSGYIERVAYWPSRVSNANLGTLTT